MEFVYYANKIQLKRMLCNHNNDKRKSDDDILTEVKRIKNEYDNFISLMSTNFLCCYQCNSTECCHVNEFKFGIQMFKRMITNDIICNSNEKKTNMNY